MTTRIEDIIERMDARLDRIEQKLDNHLERVSKAETSIQWLQGHVKIATTVFISALGGMALVLIKLILGDK